MGSNTSIGCIIKVTKQVNYQKLWEQEYSRKELKKLAEKGILLDERHYPHQKAKVIRILEDLVQKILRK